MNKTLPGLLMAAALLPGVASAGELIVGAKAGIHKMDISGFDPAPVLSGQISYEFLDLIAADVAIELELGKSASDGEGVVGLGKEDFSVTTIGAYISARTAGPIYAIGRIGVAKTELEFESTDSDETGLAVGAGVGFSLGVRTEVELTRYDVDDEQAFYLSLGLAF